MAADRAASQDINRKSLKKMGSTPALNRIGCPSVKIVSVRESYCKGKKKRNRNDKYRNY
jgi:hypothetical protein